MEPSQDAKQEAKSKETSKLRKISRSIQGKDCLRQMSLIRMGGVKKTVRGA